jgi:hypothetical protein
MSYLSRFGIAAAFCVGSGVTWLAMRPARTTFESSAAVTQQESVSDKRSARSEQWPNADFSSIEMGDRLYSLFNTFGPKAPFVETVTYTVRAPWAGAKSAWLSDYASHFKTSKHFIAHSLTGGKSYEFSRLREGDRFNVMTTERDVRFHLIVDLSRAHMWLYFIDVENNEHLLLKNFPVSLGRLDSGSASGSLTPLGIYALGDRIGIYKPGKVGHYNGESHEMIRTFGTRWIPFAKEVAKCTNPAKGFGVHGCPWRADHEGKLKEDRSVLGTYQTDGCIQLAHEDIEQLFSIIITRPTTIEIVRDYFDAELPGQPAACAAELR